jgi:hypothetical protein
MPAKATAAQESSTKEATKAGEDKASTAAWSALGKSFLDPDDYDPPEKPPLEPLFDLLEKDSSQHIARSSNTRYIVTGFDTAGDLTFGKESLVENRTPDPYDAATNPYFNGFRASRRGITLYKEILDDELSSNPNDKQISYYPAGEAAIQVSNTTNGADQYSPIYECKLNKNVLITTSDGVEYCLPFRIAKKKPPGSSVALLTHEEQIIAGIREDGASDSKSGPREDPFALEKAGSKVAEAPPAGALMGGSDPRKGITSTLDYGSSEGSMHGAAKGTRASKAKKAKANRSPAQRAKSEKAAARSTARGAKAAKAAGKRSPAQSAKRSKAASKSGVSSASRAKSSKAAAKSAQKSATKTKSSSGGMSFAPKIFGGF